MREISRLVAIKLKENRIMTNDEKDFSRYEDMLDMLHPSSSSHPRMSIRNRAAQFAPFAALTGYEAAIQETARLTDEKIELNEDQRELLDEKLLYLKEHLKEKPEVTITYFKADEKKEGGAYLTERGIIKKIDLYTHTIVLQDDEADEKIAIEDILDLQSDLHMTEISD